LGSVGFKITAKKRLPELMLEVRYLKIYFKCFSNLQLLTSASGLPLTQKPSKYAADKLWDLNHIKPHISNPPFLLCKPCLNNSRLYTGAIPSKLKENPTAGTTNMKAVYSQ